MKGAIIIGYPGIGKSTLARDANGYIDLDSGNFWVDGSRSKNWHIPYCNLAISLANQGYKVFVSSHGVVRRYLSKNASVSLFACVPDLSLKEKWIQKLEQRYAESLSDKDYKALERAKSLFQIDIEEILGSVNLYPIRIISMDYNLEELLFNSIPLEHFVKELSANDLKWHKWPEDQPPLYTLCYITLKERWSKHGKWEYKVDAAMPGGTYLDGFWDTFNDWIEGQECHVIAWASMPGPYIEEEN